jgi:hypothetical protein
MFSFPDPKPVTAPPDLNPVIRKLVEESTETFRGQLGVFAQPQFIEQYRAEITRVACAAWRAGWGHADAQLRAIPQREAE